MTRLQNLPIGMQSFAMIRQRGYLYVDKTAQLVRLIEGNERYFLSRPRRFGKSLTLSTLEAMFSGKTELFRGLAAESWVHEQAKAPAPVVRISMASIAHSDTAQFTLSLNEALFLQAKAAGLKLETTTLGNRFVELLQGLYAQSGPVVVLIDEYDKPILDHIGDLPRADELREALRSFYSVLKDCDDYLRFVLLTGISKFSKTGVFSAMNNLEDISMDTAFGALTGYTQEELESNFAAWLQDAASRMHMESQELLHCLKKYYDGFCFDGTTKLYNPFSILQSLKKAALKNFWYDSGSPSFVVEYMKTHQIQTPEEYRHLGVDIDFASAQEIERAKPESFLYQSGYLTIEKLEGQLLTLDYPNLEVLNALSKMYLEYVYHVPGYKTLGTELLRSLKSGNWALS